MKRLHTQERIDRYTAGGWWTGDTIDQLLRAQVSARPGALAIADPPNKADLLPGEIKRLTWSELDTEVDWVAGVLRGRGIGPGDVVAVQLPNSVELAVTFLAVVRVGAVVTPFPVQYREYELNQLCALAGAVIFVTSTTAAARVPENIPALTWGADLDTASSPPGASGVPYEASGVPYEAHPADPVTICWTSGTEATPKGVPRCHYDWLAVASTCAAAPGLTEDDVILNPFPMVNMAGIGGVFLPWLKTGSVLVQHHPFDLPTYLGQIAAEGVTYTLAPPALLTMLLQQEAILARTDLTTLTRIGSGSAPLPPPMVKGWQERYGIAIINFFGSNEGVALLSDPVHMPDPEDRARFFPRPDAPGTTWPGTLGATRTKLVDPLGTEIVEAGIPGELCLSGPTVFSGYLPGTAAADPFDGDGYLMTGDVFEIAGDQGQYLRYVDRAKDLVIRGGMNIAPAELEALVSGHPAVAEVAVVGYADEVLGERVCVVLVPKPGQTVDLASVVDHLRGRGIASYKLPERLELVEALPRNPLGKILKRELKESLATGG
ncbi:class I adenylate-forming enzyme family protein [Streptosporangium sp. NBC_01469]|uniref:class I adenylate-forming enzyme family protein n=1 Tax=Streptosporangium sp. NBC_01469 TaxID=2903898 RepID=UPI002E2D9C9B|nr:class I adenylate-forming enzyme family protein [Streptosporangium sp. NBC_01469]